MDDVTRAAHVAVDKGDASALKAEQQIRQAVIDAAQDIREATDRARLKSLQMSDDLNGYVRAYPFTSLWVAFATGIVACSIFRRQ